MGDRRTRRQKLQAMAAQSVSPHEAEIARRKLAELPAPESPSAPPDYGIRGTRTWTTTTASSSAASSFYETVRRWMDTSPPDFDEAEYHFGFDPAAPGPDHTAFRVRRRHRDPATGRVWWEWEEA